MKNFLRKKVTFIRLQFVGCQSILAKATLGNGSYAETKRCGNRKLIQFFLLFQKKKSILGRYINTLFFYYKRHKWFPHFKNVMLMFFFSFAVKIYLIHHVKFVSMPVYRNSCVSCYIWDRTRTCWNKPSKPGDLIKFDKNSFNRMFNQRVHRLYCQKVSKTLAMGT